jgi:hypothetical protein
LESDIVRYRINRILLAFAGIIGIRPVKLRTIVRLLRSRHRWRHGTAATAAILLGMTLPTAGPLHAQYSVQVHVDTSKPRAMFYPAALGTAADAWDRKAFSAETIQLLEDAGITIMRYPGNDGIDGLYHWSTGTVTNPFSKDKAPDFGLDQRLARVLPLMEQLGMALITVNYGSNLDGCGGGEPAEAAAWVPCGQY